MNFTKNNSVHGGGTMQDAGFEQQEQELASVLAEFRNSVHAWSEREFARERKPVPVRRPLFGFRLAAASALLLLVAGITGGVALRQHLADAAIPQARQNAEKQRQADEQARMKQLEMQKKNAAARQDDALLDAIDSDVAQETPEAMEPLASLMGR